MAAFTLVLLCCAVKVYQYDCAQRMNRYCTDSSAGQEGHSRMTFTPIIFVLYAPLARTPEYRYVPPDIRGDVE